MSEKAERVVGWTLAAGYVITCSIIVIGPSDVHIYFCSGSLQCARDWISATGGWSAVVAAGMTVLYLSKQISESQKQHSQTLRATIEQRISIARRFDYKSSQIEQLWKSIYVYAEAIYDIEEFGILWLRYNCDELCNIIDLQYFDEFDSTIHQGNIEIRDIRHSVQRLLESLEEIKTTDGFMKAQESRWKLQNIAQIIENTPVDQYIKTGKRSAEAYIRDWEY